MPRFYTFVAPCLFLVALSAFAQSFQPGGTHVVRDSKGQLVGQYDAAWNGLPPNGPAWATGAIDRVSMVINGYPVYFGVTSQKLLLDDNPLYFDQLECHGTAFLKPASVFDLSVPAAFAPDGTVRIAPSPATSLQTVLSEYDDSYGCRNEGAGFPSLPLLATEAGPNMRARFTPPFTIAPGAIPPAVDVPATDRFLLFAILAVVTLIALLRLRG